MSFSWLCVLLTRCRYTRPHLRQLQLNDPDTGTLIHWLEIEGPTESELDLCSPAIKNYWPNRIQMVMKDGILFYRWVRVSDYKLLFVVPHDLRSGVLLSCHDTKSSAHSQKRTLSRLKESFYWYGMSAHCNNYVMTCAACNVSKKANVKAKGLLGSYHAGSPMERLHLDILGPLQVSRSRNKYILMVIHPVTKWVECIAVLAQTVNLIARAVVDCVISKFGAPLQIHTSQGHNSAGDLFKKL